MIFPVVLFAAALVAETFLHRSVLLAPGSDDERVAGIGSGLGVSDAQLFAVVAGMSILTTLAVPPVLRRLAARE